MNDVRANFPEQSETCIKAERNLRLVVSEFKRIETGIQTIHEIALRPLGNKRQRGEEGIEQIAKNARRESQQHASHEPARDLVGQVDTEEKRHQNDVASSMQTEGPSYEAR